MHAITLEELFLVLFRPVDCSCADHRREMRGPIKPDNRKKLRRLVTAVSGAPYHIVTRALNSLSVDLYIPLASSLPQALLVGQRPMSSPLPQVLHHPVVSFTCMWRRGRRHPRNKAKREIHESSRGHGTGREWAGDEQGGWESKNICTILCLPKPPKEGEKKIAEQRGNASTNEGTDSSSDSITSGNKCYLSRSDNFRKSMMLSLLRRLRQSYSFDLQDRLQSCNCSVAHSRRLVLQRCEYCTGVSEHDKRKSGTCDA